MTLLIIIVVRSTLADAAGFFLLAGAFFFTLTSESELSELLWLSLDESDELQRAHQSIFAVFILI